MNCPCQQSHVCKFPDVPGHSVAMPCRTRPCAAMQVQVKR